MLSRILEHREMEEWQTRRQQRREGRVRAAPVLVRPCGAPESRSSVEETLRAERAWDFVSSRDASTEMGHLNISGDSCSRPDDRRQLKPLTSLSTDNESSSSDSSTSTGMGSARSAFRLPGLSRGRSEKAKTKHPSAQDADDRSREDKRKLPRLRIKGGHFSFSESSQSPPLSNKNRKRCYSFEKGDEVLTVTSPTLAPEIYAQSGSPVEDRNTTQSETNGFLAAISGLLDLPVKDDNFPSTGTPFPRRGSGSISHSSSANTVKWLGDTDGGGDGDGDGVSGNTGYKGAEDSG